MAKKDDIWYAVNTTQVIRRPQKTLETFGATQIRYYLLAELLDTPNAIRVREGTLYSERPQIITQSQYANSVLNGFGEKAEEYASWLRNHGELLGIIKYGLQFRREVDHEVVIHDTLENVSHHVCDKCEADTLAAVLVGADELWEVSLLKFGVDFIQQSAPTNLQEFTGRQIQRTNALDQEIEDAFRAALMNKTSIDYLGELLRKSGKFEQYEDRFFALLRDR